MYTRYINHSMSMIFFEFSSNKKVSVKDNVRKRVSIAIFFFFLYYLRLKSNIF